VGRGVTLTPRQTKTIRELKQAGWTNRAIASEVGTSSQAVGLELRRTKPRRRIYTAEEIPAEWKGRKKFCRGCRIDLDISEFWFDFIRNVPRAKCKQCYSQKENRNNKCDRCGCDDAGGTLPVSTHPGAGKKVFLHSYCLEAWIEENGDG